MDSPFHKGGWGDLVVKGLTVSLLKQAMTISLPRQWSEMPEHFHGEFSAGEVFAGRGDDLAGHHID